MVQLSTPISEEAAASLQVGDTVEISGYILCGRDAVLPKVLKMIEDGTVAELGVDLHGQVIFHTAVRDQAASGEGTAASEDDSRFGSLQCGVRRDSSGDGFARRKDDGAEGRGLPRAGHGSAAPDQGGQIPRHHRRGAREEHL